MHVTLVHIHVKAGHLDAFLAATADNHSHSVQEPGNLRFDVLRHPDDPGYFMLYEVYRTEADARAHKETAHYARWRDAVADMMAEPRRGEPWVGLLPEAG